MEQLGSDIRKKLQRKWGLDAQSRRKKYMEEVFRLIFRRTGRHFMCCYAIETRFLQLEELTVFGQSFDCNHLPLHLTFLNLQHVHLPEPPGGALRIFKMHYKPPPVYITHPRLRAAE